MDEKSISLRVQRKWKAIQITGWITGTAALLFMSMKLLELTTVDSSQKILLLVLFSLIIAIGFYGLLYGIRHRLVFSENRVIRHGVFARKTINYAQIEAIYISSSYWSLRQNTVLLKNPSALHLDYKYDPQETEKLKGFLEDVLDKENGPEVVQL